MRKIVKQKLNNKNSRVTRSQKNKDNFEQLKNITNFNTADVQVKQKSSKEKRMQTLSYDQSKQSPKSDAQEEKQPDSDYESPPKKLKSNEENVGKIDDKNKTEEVKTEAAVEPECSTSKQARLSLRSQLASSDDTPAPPKGEVPDQLYKVISNLYINAAKRLQLEYPSRCAYDLAFCYQQHYRTEPPEKTNHFHSKILNCGLENQRYLFFVSTCISMCLRNEFPGEGIFTQLIELILSINENTYHNEALAHSYSECIDLFNIIVSTFPPCWLALRHHYIQFFQRPIDSMKLSSNESQFTKSERLFDIMLDLLENTLNLCDENVLHEEPSSNIAAVCSDTESADNKTPTKPIKKIVEQQTPNLLVSPFSEPLSSGCTELFNLQDWEERENNLQTFEALTLPVRLERIFVALNLILQILEDDFVMWILHHHKKTKDFIFCMENRPLIAMVFDVKQNIRMTETAKQMLNIFSIAVNKGLARSRLQVLERYIALLAMFNNTAEMENTAIGVKYPYLGVKTKNFISDFFKIFKSHNANSITAFVDTIEILRIPFVRYEFIDQFLQLFYFSKTDVMSPKKLAYDILKQRWLKYNPRAEIQNNEDELSREQYLALLLLALKSYCQFHGTTSSFLHVFANPVDIDTFKTPTDSKFRHPTQGSGVLALEKMAEDIEMLEQKFKMSVVISRPQVEVPLADICIDEALISKYRTDFKYIVKLQEFLEEHSTKHKDFTDWLVFLNDYSPKNYKKK